MRLTNRLSLPSSIVNAVARDPYSKGDANLSVTQLIGPARKLILERIHSDELTEDVADRLWALLGSIVHEILDRHDAEAWTEERLFIERHGWRISGKFDRVLLEDGSLSDYKLTSTYTVKQGPKSEWIAQANLYATMLREHGHTINRAEAVTIFRDWQRSKAQHDPDYPQIPVAVLPMPLWTPAECESYILARLTAHADAQHELPLCTAEERWERPAKLALIREGNVKATSLHGTLIEAEAAREHEIADDLAKRLAKRKTPPKEPLVPLAFRIDTRPAEQIRCRDYCAAAPVCEQWKALDQTIRIRGEAVFK